MKYNIIHQIIARIAKETQMFDFLINHYNYKLVNETIDYTYRGMNTMDFYCLINHVIHDKTITAKNTDINLSCYFNMILRNLLYPKILQYIKINGLYEKLDYELSHTLTRRRKFTTNQYLNYIENVNLNPYNFFLFAFNWSKSKYGLEYWSSQHNRYISFLTDYLNNK